MKTYKILSSGRFVQSSIPGRYVGWRRGKIFGRLDCKSGMRMKKENRVFFLTWEDAIQEGYRPCKNCRPTKDDAYPKR
jgi:methylphosphotriester-DNA--protein-cysteine methyltransferase